jgi:hypothetical protein
MFEQFFQVRQELCSVFSIDDTVIEGPGDGCGGLLAELIVRPDPARLNGAYATKPCSNETAIPMLTDRNTRMP